MKRTFTGYRMYGLNNTGRKWLLLFTLFFAGIGSYAQNVSAIAFSPSTISVGTGQTFTTSVRVEIASGSVDVVEVHFDFDNTMLAVQSISVSSGSILPFELFGLESVSTINANGRVGYAAGTFSNFPTTSFEVLSITFTTLQAGTSALTFRRPPTGNPITNVIRSGVTALTGGVTNASVTALTCSPPSATISHTTTCNGQSFDLVLANSAGTGPFDLTINGSPYNNISQGGIITTINPPTERIWPANPSPVPPSENDGQPIEVGVKFRSSVNGFVKGIRFYNGTSNAGTYTGKLYSSSGTLLASQVFVSVTTNGWQEVSFTSPVQVTANTVYVASYYSTAGNYCTSDFYFITNNNGVTTGSLTAIGSTEDDANGIYNFPGEGFPSTTWIGHSPNYWVDVLFTPANFTYNLTAVTDDNGCTITGALQTLNVVSVSCNTLPVTLLDLSATPQGKNVILNWSTSSEFDNKGFEIQRSSNNILWEGVGFVNGAGTTSITQHYTYVDKDLFPQRYYYRLKQVDIDEKYKFSMIVTALLNEKADYSLKQNYPNPFRSETTIQYTLPIAEKVTLTVHDANGRVLSILASGTKQAGTHAVNFYTGRLPKGMYYYKLQAGSFSEVKKMIIQ